MLALTVRAYARLEKQVQLNQAWLHKQQRSELELCAGNEVKGEVAD